MVRIKSSRLQVGIVTAILVSTFLNNGLTGAQENNESQESVSQSVSPKTEKKRNGAKTKIDFRTLAGRKIDKRVLYIGANKKYERTKNWIAYLSVNFKQVEQIRLSQFDKVDKSKFDVFIFDAEQSRLMSTSLGNVGILEPPTPNLVDFDRPTILIGETGPNVSRKARLMFDSL